MGSLMRYRGCEGWGAILGCLGMFSGAQGFLR